MTGFTEETKYRREQGDLEYQTIEELDAALKSLGYKLDHSEDIRYVGSYLTGERSGTTYAASSCGISEIDTGRSAFHFQSRRDANYIAMQEIRKRGAFVSLPKAHCIFEL